MKGFIKTINEIKKICSSCVSCRECPFESRYEHSTRYYCYFDLPHNYDAKEILKRIAEWEGKGKI